MNEASDRNGAGALIGESRGMREVRALIRKLAPSSIPVLIEGPTGCGKELVARALHRESGRSGAFVPVNICAIGEGMFEDALFGHVRGAFTGAVADAGGYLLEAHRGTMFLDEVGGLSSQGQAKLLRAIETKEYRQIGGRCDRRSEFRLVSATNEALADLACEGHFRHDLLYRLRGAVIALRPLSERLEDIPLLARHFAALSPTTSKQPVTLTDAALETLMTFSWPGNVRELKALIECAVALSEVSGVTQTAITRAASLSRPARRQLSHRRRDFMGRRLLDVLEETDWNVDETARILGVHPATVYRRLARMSNSPSRGPGILRHNGRSDWSPAQDRSVRERTSD